MVNFHVTIVAASKRTGYATVKMTVETTVMSITPSVLSQLNHLANHINLHASQRITDQLGVASIGNGNVTEKEIVEMAVMRFLSF